MGSSEAASRWTAKSLERLPASLQFSLLVLGVFVFFGAHNFLQEAITEKMNKQHSVILGYTEVLGVAVCSFIERCYIQRERGRIAPLSAYPLLTLCLMGSSALSNISLDYINFPTKVVFRSCKLIPTMIIASIVHKKVFSGMEYACATAICAGLVLFAAADWSVAPVFHPKGLFLVILSVCADAILPNAQERLFRLGSSRLEVTLYTNLFSLLAYSIATLWSGDLVAAAKLTWNNQRLMLYFSVYTFVAYVAISVHMTVVKRYGGVTAVLVATGRKGMTLVLSFLCFPKHFSIYYLFGALLVLGGLLVVSLLNMKQKQSSESVSPLASDLRRLKAHRSDVENAMSDDDSDRGEVEASFANHRAR